VLHENYLRRHLLSPSGPKEFTTRVETTSGLQAHNVLLDGHFLFFGFFFFFFKFKFVLLLHWGKVLNFFLNIKFFFRKLKILNFNRIIFQYFICQIIIPFIFGVSENIQRVTPPRSCSS